MVHRLRFHTAIPDDLVKALDYYEGISHTLANRFRNSIDKRLDDITNDPELFALDVPPIRFASIDRFPYLIFFTVKSGFVYIIAIAHGASNPNKWRSRK